MSALHDGSGSEPIINTENIRRERRAAVLRNPDTAAVIRSVEKSLTNGICWCQRKNPSSPHDASVEIVMGILKEEKGLYVTTVKSTKGCAHAWTFNMVCLEEDIEHATQYALGFAEREFEAWSSS